VPLTTRNDVRDSLMDSVFARGDLSKAMPKYQFPDRESFPVDVFQVIQDELLLDGNARQNLATFCQTWEEPEIHKIMDLATLWCREPQFVGRRNWIRVNQLSTNFSPGNCGGSGRAF
jgi:Pyridoxal-dependent decarboxylase conserved domain